MAIKNCVIFDLDGTLADCRHRLPHIKNGNNNWAAFFDAMTQDTPNTYVVHLAKLLRVAVSQESERCPPEIVICSGRPDSHAAQTVHWLNTNNVPYDRLLMRKTGDYRPDTIVKKQMLETLWVEDYRVLFAVDDRPDVIEMWRSNGVPCFAVEDHNWR